MPKLGELGGSVEILRKMRDQLVESQRKSEIEDERWTSLGEAATMIQQACDSRDLEELVTSFRRLKNRLRRPAVRKELARLESKPEGNDDQDGEDKKGETLTKEVKGKEREKIPAKDEKNPTGACKCAQCGKVIDGSREPCVDDALCTYCALKNKVIPSHKQTKKKVVVPPTGVDTSGQDTGGQQGENRESLRTRKYLG